MNLVEQKIEEVLEEKQDPFWLVFEREKGGIAEFYKNNKNEIKAYIEKVISERKLTLMQLYNLCIIYFKDDTTTQEATKRIEELISSTKKNYKNLKLLNTLFKNVDSKDSIDVIIKQLDAVLED